VRSCSGFGLVIPKVLTKVSTRKFSIFIQPVSPPGGCGRLTFVVNDRDAWPPAPAREELDKPPLDAEDLEREIGDSEPWDEASEDSGDGSQDG
jgi:hypothetical protein